MKNAMKFTIVHDGCNYYRNEEPPALKNSCRINTVSGYAEDGQYILFSDCINYMMHCVFCASIDDIGDVIDTLFNSHGHLFELSKEEIEERGDNVFLSENGNAYEVEGLKVVDAGRSPAIYFLAAEYTDSQLPNVELAEITEQNAEYDEVQHQVNETFASKSQIEKMEKFTTNENDVFICRAHDSASAYMKIW